MFGLLLPKGMKVVASFPGVAHAVGNLTTKDVATYVRDRVDAPRVELGALGTVFPGAHI